MFEGLSGGPAGFFFANDPQSAGSQALRQKIALAMLMKKSAAPKNLGEGLYSIGSSIGDALSAKSVMDADKDAQLVASKLGAPQDPSNIAQVAPAGDEPKAGLAAVAPSSTTSSQPLTPAGPATPLPPDLQQSPDPSAPTRLLGSTFGKPPALAPTARADYSQRPSVADFGQKPVLAPTPPPTDVPSGTPVMAQGGDDPRRAIALAMLRQGQPGQPQSPIFAPALAPASPMPSDHGIKTAPPAQMPQADPPSAKSTYVPPDVALPQGASVEGPSKREMELRAVLAANQGNPYVGSSPAAVELQNLQEARAKRQTYADERFKAEISQVNEQKKLRQQGLMDQDKRAADVAHTQVQTETARVKTINGREVVLGNDGVYHIPKIEGVDPNASPGGKLNETQADTVKFLRQQYLMSEQIKGKDHVLANPGIKDALAGRVGINSALGNDYRSANNAADLWIAANLRDISGATIGTKEHADQKRMLFPVYGDPPAEVRRKAEARNAIEEGMKQSLGSASDHADYAKKQVQESIQARRDAINDEMKGVVPSGVGDVKINKRTGEKRTWNGRNWEEI